MTKNMGIIDRVLRAVVAATVAVLIVLGVLQGTAAIIIGILGGILLVTSLVGFCPIYAPFKLSTLGKKKA